MRSNFKNSAEPRGRSNQRRRTRKDLLSAAARLLRSGVTPDMDQVAEAAMVSRATAYRYFPTVEALLLEAPLDGAVPDAASVFDDDHSIDPVQRIEKGESALHEMVYRNAAQLRLMLAASLQHAAKAADGSGNGVLLDAADRNLLNAGASQEQVPVRQNRRMPLIEAALAPARHLFGDLAYERLCGALALIFGVESMVVFTDVLGVDEKRARAIKSWAAAVLVRAAMKESPVVE